MTHTRMTRERRLELEQCHLGWLHNPNVSRGQLEDSKTILNALAEIDALEAEKNELARELMEDSRLLESLEAERDELKRAGQLIVEESDGAIKNALFERDVLQAQVEIARERLGPAGYKILQEHQALQKRVSELEAALVNTDCKCRWDYVSAYHLGKPVSQRDKITWQCHRCKALSQREAKDTGAGT